MRIIKEKPNHLLFPEVPKEEELPSTQNQEKEEDR